MADLIGWIGNIFFIVGAVLLAKRNVYGFICNAMGNILYVFQGMLVETLSLCLLSVALILINMVGAWNWKGENDAKAKEV